jgi:hypothetical protein
MIPRVTLQLLDTPAGKALQQWVFEGKDLIRIGRSPENDVVIADRFVSREHVYLSRYEEAWVVTVLTPQGILCGTRKLFNLRLSPETAHGFQFQLGSSGPVLRLELDAEEHADSTTRLHAGEVLPALTLDPVSLRREVTEISEGDYFRKLRASLQQFRESRRADQEVPRTP